MYEAVVAVVVDVGWSPTGHVNDLLNARAKQNITLSSACKRTHTHTHTHTHAHQGEWPMRETRPWRSGGVGMLRTALVLDDDVLRVEQAPAAVVRQEQLVAHPVLLRFPRYVVPGVLCRRSRRTSTSSPGVAD
jgi:hypothetical protein